MSELLSPDHEANDDALGNAAFIEKYAGPGRIGLCGGRDFINKLIRKAQAPLTHDGHRSLWSHAFVFSERRVDGQWWVIESDLDLRYRQIRLGVQENRVERYYDAEAFPNIAILDFGLDQEQIRKVQIAGLDLLSGLSSYSISELVGTLMAMHSRRLRRRSNLLAKEGALYCSALVQHCYAAAGIEFLAGVPGKNIAPHDIDESPLPHSTHRILRDLGVSTIRELTHEARMHFG
ncbi:MULTISPECIES: hypothetical protein [unclassified Lysobacter]|uniref:hypothetical protein n=1 Tax=unclassified Lysobacter TaxID=2635362 RepID=UPI0006FD5239|nr:MULTISPECIES: hypothetical protein [unclassified Lysobacter]KQZ57692.1 hypothetical protein ASD53_08755 [Lysobacter sp. Root559]KRC33840.1 hypothetical protein ASE10_12915 [Lysobacter sp. Root76]KRD69176.1 hypothetical protein ASE45_08355 [Lysobacter sp. Root96]